MGKGTTIFLDEEAFKIITEKKRILKLNGFGNPTYSDAIRMLDKKLYVEYNEVIE